MKLQFSIVLLLGVLTGCASAPSSQPTSKTDSSQTQPANTAIPDQPQEDVTVTVLGEETLGPGTVLQQQTNPAVQTLRKEAQQAVLDSRYDSAVVALERAVRIEPKDPYLWLDLAKLHFTQGDYQQAIQLAEKAKRLAGVDGVVKSEADRLIQRSR